MLFNAITYSRTKNLGNYESERIEMTADVEPGDDPTEVLASLKDRVQIELGLKSDLTLSAEASDGIPESDEENLLY